MNKQRFLEQVRADCIYARADRCKTPVMDILHDSMAEKMLAVATFGAYSYYRTNKIIHKYNDDYDKFIECVKEISPSK
jgi:hypothetical protein